MYGIDTSGIIIIADSRDPIGQQLAAGQNWSAEAAGLVSAVDAWKERLVLSRRLPGSVLRD